MVSHGLDLSGGGAVTAKIARARHLNGGGAVALARMKKAPGLRRGPVVAAKGKSHAKVGIGLTGPAASRFGGWSLPAHHRKVLNHRRVAIGARLYARRAITPTGAQIIEN